MIKIFGEPGEMSVSMGQKSILHTRDLWALRGPLKTDKSLSQKLLYELRWHGKHNLPCHAQMQVLSLQRESHI